MHDSTMKHVGLDDHKDSICVAVADADGGEVRAYGRIDHTPDQVGKAQAASGEPSVML